MISLINDKNDIEMIKSDIINDKNDIINDKMIRMI